MFPRRFALWGGIAMLAIGVVSLIPSMAGSTDNLPPLLNESSYGLFLGLFPMNIINKAVLIAFGIAGIAAAGSKFDSLPASIFFARVTMFVMGVAAILGLFGATDTLGGYWPLFGGEVWMHAVFALFGGYFGYALSSHVPTTSPRGTSSDFRTSTRGI
jgi:hypothetical protein